MKYVRFVLVMVSLTAVTLFGTLVACADGLKVGFSRVDITPPLGSYVAGYYQPRHATAVLDPLQINMLAFSDGRKTALLAQIDTIGLYDYVANPMRDAIAKATGVDREAILLHASHTHDGGYLMMWGKDDTAASETDLLYIRMCISRAADAAVNALADLKPARLSCGRGVAERITFGRRYLMRNGKVATNPGTNNPDIVRPAGNPPDEEVQLLRIDREGGKPIAVINFQSHPDVVGGTAITSDWPGLTRGVFEAATFGETRAVVINGAQGDLNHCNVLPRPGELNGLKRDFDAVDRGYDHARHMANVLAASALGVWMKCVPLEAGPIGYAVESVKIPAQKGDVDPKKDLVWAKDVCELHERSKKEGVAATASDYVTKKYGWTDMELTTEVARACRIRSMATRDDFHDVPLTTLAIGRSVAFATFPGEPFNDIGKTIKAKSPFGLTILACLTNGCKGYFPCADSFAEGGYESAVSPFGPSVESDLVTGELRLLQKLESSSFRSCDGSPPGYF